MPATPPIRIRIGASLDTSVERSFASLEKRAGTAQNAIVKQQQRSAQQMARTAEQSAKAQARAIEQANRAASAADAQRLKAIEAAARAQVRAAELASRAQARAAAQAERAEQRAATNRQKVLERAARAAERALEREARAQQRQSERAGESFARRTSHRTTRFALPNAPLGSMAARMGGEIARGVGVDFSVSGALQRSRDIEQAAVNLTNAGFMRGAQGPAGTRQDPRRIIAEARTAGTAAGMAPDQAIGGLGAFVGKTGDLATGRAVLAGMASLSKATGANLDDMVAAAGDVAAAFGDMATSEAEAQARAEQIQEIMRVIAGQGKLGAVEIKDLASQMAKVSTSATAFAGDRSQNIGTMGALAQMARQRGGAATANIAAGSVASFVNTLRTPARANAFESRGVKLEAGGGKFRDPQEIIIDAIKAAGEDTQAFKTMFANVQGARAVEGFRQIYLEQGGGEAGEKAVRSKFRELGAGAAITADEEAVSLARALDTTSSKAQQFQNRLDQITEQAADRLLPQLEKAEPALLRFADAVASTTTWVIENPRKAIAGAIALSIARAGIESTMRAGIERLILGAGGTRAASVAGVAGTLGAAGTIGALAVTTLTVGMMTIDHLFNKAQENQRSKLAADIEAGNKDMSARTALKGGDLGRAEELTEQVIAEREANIAKNKADMSDFWRSIGDATLGLFDTDAIRARDTAERRTLEQQERELAQSRELLSQIQQQLATGINVNNLPEAIPGRDEQ